MSEYKTLAPPACPGGTALEYRYAKIGDGLTPHLLRDETRDDGLHISDAELLALATTTGIWREVPEVRALVETAHRVEVMLDTLSLLGVSSACAMPSCPSSPTMMPRRRQNERVGEADAGR
jgi:hypothetical protein